MNFKHRRTIKADGSMSEEIDFNLIERNRNQELFDKFRKAFNFGKLLKGVLSFLLSLFSVLKNYL